MTDQPNKSDSEPNAGDPAADAAAQTPAEAAAIAAAQQKMMANEAIKFMTWWRCAGCLGVLFMIALGSLLGVWLTLRSDVFGNDPWVTEKDVAAPGIPDAAPVQPLQFVSELTASAPVLTARANQWLAESPLAGPNSRCQVTFIEPGVVQLKASLCVPEGLPFPGSLLTGAFYNVSLTFAGTFDRQQLEMLDLRLYRIGERPEAPIKTLADVHALGESFKYFLNWHPQLDQALQRIRRVTVRDSSCQVIFE
ncbi:MAG: hypothetical protein AAF581_22350 [Planctomycetota bacterium]